VLDSRTPERRPRTSLRSTIRASHRGVGAALALAAALLAGCARLATSLDFSLAPPPPVPTRPLAATKGHLNVRSGPGMNHRIIAVLPPQTTVEILGEEGIWRRVVVEQRGRTREGWLSSKYLMIAEAKPTPAPTPEPEPIALPEPVGAVPLALGDPSGKPDAVPLHPTRTPETERIAALEPTPTPDLPQPTPTATPEPTPIVRAARSVISSGAYGAEIRPIREALAEARFADLEAGLAILSSEMRSLGPDGGADRADPRLEALRMLERAVVDVDRGRLDRGLAHLQEGKERSSGSRLAAAPNAEGAGAIVHASTGSPESAANRLLPFERVWLANYDAFLRLLRGDDLGLNLTRVAIERQLGEEKALEERLVSLEAALFRARSRVGERRADAIQELLEQDYAPASVRAEPAVHALASPFPHYLAGVLQEILARGDPSLREEALAAYARALRMAPADDLFRHAVDDLSTAHPPTDDRVVHVLVAEGFVPEKRLLTRDLVVDDRQVLVRLPIQVPVPSSVSGARLRIKGAKTETPLSEIANLEASVLRLERDLTVERAVEVLRAVPALTESDDDAPGGWFGFFGGARPTPPPSVAPAAMPEPDTASWMLLPARIYAARLRLSKDPHTIQIEILREDGKPIDSVDVLLDPTAHSFVYLRTAGRILTTRSREPDWFSSATMAASAIEPAPPR
jgi:uncharacterized protein